MSRADDLLARVFAEPGDDEVRKVLAVKTGAFALPFEVREARVRDAGAVMHGIAGSSRRDPGAPNQAMPSRSAATVRRVALRDISATAVPAPSALLMLVSHGNLRLVDRIRHRLGRARSNRAKGRASTLGSPRGGLTWIWSSCSASSS